MLCAISFSHDQIRLASLSHQFYFLKSSQSSGLGRSESGIIE